MPSKVTETSPLGLIPEHSFKYDPLRMVRALYISFAKGLFAAAPVGCYHWTPDEVSEIYISSETPIRADKVGKRPAISYTRGPVSFYSLGMDDMLRFNFATGKKTKTVLVPGVMSINCCSRNYLESERLAWIVAEHMWLLRELLMKKGFFEIGRQPQISSPSPAGSIVANAGSDEWFCTTIQSPFQFPRMSQFTPLNKMILDNIELEFHTEAVKVLSGGQGLAGQAGQGGIGGPNPSTHERPLNLHECAPPAFSPASDAHGGTPDPAGTGPKGPPKVPHPLDPAKMVVVRSVSPYRQGIRPASMGGRVLPIADPCVKES